MVAQFAILRAMSTNRSIPEDLAALRFNAISKRYGAFQALNNVSFDVRQGEFFALLGPNGAGKSTLIGCLAGLLQPSSGKALVMGLDAQAEYQEARRQVGVVPQELAYDPFFTAREVLQLQSGYFGLGKNKAWIDELLAELGLEDKADLRMRGLSGGMKRRVLIAQALVHKPPVIVLDEPTAGVDVELRQLLWRFIRRLHGEGHTVVLTTHYLEEAEALCDRIAILQHGELKALDTKQELLARHASELLQVRLRDNDAVQWPVGAKARRLGDIWQVEKPGNASYAEFVAQLAVMPEELLSVAPKQVGLEEVFLNITGGANHD